MQTVNSSLLGHRRANFRQIGIHRDRHIGNFPSYSDNWPNHKENSVGIRFHPRTDCNKSVERNLRDKHIGSYRSCSVHNCSKQNVNV